ncbi:hypothetical protein [Salinimicrobium sediminilitoris]|uniref:hypothetical protein n=1 Tax=Salinimicrobium sediminilitoris TaxID=2876715 RepID=UPI001E5A27D3|nr:hypothetical protein [Salinimicrobium sediminilitoris]MCC8360682.1 hypothetical protein [Salinimicrobium sediminilitoris]
MTFVQIVSILGMIPLFSMRTFLPAFLAALFLRYPQYFPGMGEIVSPATDSFITKDWVLYTLGGLSLLEIVGDKSTEIRNFLKDAETYLKPLIFFIINLNLLDEASVEVLGEVQWAAFDPLWILLLFGTLVVHWLAGLRRDFISFLEDVDEDDNFYISKISSWLEDSLVVFGFLLLIWLGLIMVAVYAAAIGFFILLKKRTERKLEQQKLACPNCGKMNLPFAVKCYNCKAPQPEVHQIGVFGQRKKELVSSLEKHRLHLASHRKCPDCGNKLKNTDLFQQCDLCGSTLFDSPTPKEYINYQDIKFYKLAGVSFLLGFIPIVGFVVSAVLANVYLFTPYRRYIPKGKSFLTKIFIKILTFLFFIFGIALGFIAAPVYIILRYFIWKQRFIKRSTT